MKNKAKLYEWIDRFNNNELSGEEYYELVHLLNSDLRVREEVLLDRELNSMLKDKELLDLRKKIKKVCNTGGKREIRYNKYLLIAAALLIILSIGYTINYFILTFHHQKHKTTYHKSDFSQRRNENVLLFPVPKQPEVYTLSGYETPVKNEHSRENDFNQDLLASYHPNKTFEYLAGIAYRSTGFSLVSPVNSASFRLEENIVFYWKTGRPAKTSLYINDNRGVLLYESEYNNYPSVQIKAGFLGYGLFYYKIVQEEEVVCFGKFIVQ